MKKIAFSIAILCIFLTALTGCGGEELPDDNTNNNTPDTRIEFERASPLRSQPSLEGNISMSVADIDKNENQLTVTMFNTSEYIVTTGLSFSVDFFDGRHWRRIPWLGGAVHLVGFSIIPGDSRDFIKNLHLVEPLEQGLHRVRKDMFRNVDIPYRPHLHMHDVVAEFYWE